MWRLHVSQPHFMIKSVDTVGCTVISATFACQKKPHAGEITLVSKKVSSLHVVVPTTSVYRNNPRTSEILANHRMYLGKLKYLTRSGSCKQCLALKYQGASTSDFVYFGGWRNRMTHSRQKPRATSTATELRSAQGESGI